MKFKLRLALIATLALAVVSTTLFVKRRFDDDMRRALAHAAQGSVLLSTPCGPIEYQEVGAGVPLLAVHGSGGGYDQGMAFANGLAPRGIRVIAMSRFGYLRTPMPTDASAAAQADSATPMPPWVEATMMRVIGSDFLFWCALRVARNQVVKVVLATPPELLQAARAQERARIDAMLTNILPVSLRSEGLRSDTAAGKHLSPWPLASIRAPTLVISARDDRYGTYASAQYTAGQIPGAKFIGFDEGGHTWVGHNEEVMAAIVRLLLPQN